MTLEFAHVFCGFVVFARKILCQEIAILFRIFDIMSFDKQLFGQRKCDDKTDMYTGCTKNGRNSLKNDEKFAAVTRNNPNVTVCALFEHIYLHRLSYDCHTCVRCPKRQ